MTLPRRLNVGCGLDYKEGWTNLDLNPTGSLKVDVEWNILEFPWPFDDASFDHLLMSHVLEHVPHTIPGVAQDGFLRVLEEAWRVLANGGTLEARYPHRSQGLRAFKDPTHTRILMRETFDYFSPDDPWNFYTPARFRRVRAYRRPDPRFPRFLRIGGVGFWTHVRDRAPWLRIPGVLDRGEEVTILRKVDGNPPVARS